MKKSLKISTLSSKRFDENELKNVKGGGSNGTTSDDPCEFSFCCNCPYADKGGSSVHDNYFANQLKSHNADGAWVHSPNCE